MGAFTKAITTAFWHLGGTSPYTTPHDRDVVYNNILDEPTSIAGVSVNAERALGYIPFYAAVRTIAEDVAGLPFHVYRRRADGGRDKDTDHWLDPLIAYVPNPEMTSFTFLEVAMSHVLTWGNHYSEKEYNDDGTIHALWPLRPDAMEVLRDQSGRLFYRYRTTSGEQIDLPAQRVFHLHGLGFDGRVGYSVISKARRSLALGIATETHGTNAFDKGQIPPAVLKASDKLSPDARANLKDTMDSWRGLENRHRMALLEEGLDIQVIGIPNDDAKFIETMDWAAGTMATLFRIPPHMLGFVTKSTSWGTGIEQQGIGYVTHTLRPWLVRFEQQVKKDLLAGDDAHYVKFKVDGLMRGDSAARWTAYRAGLDLGVFNIDDVREMEDRNTLPDGLGTKHFVQLNRVDLAEIGQLSLKDRVDAFVRLVTVGVQPPSASEVTELPVEHTQLESVQVAEQGDYARKMAELAEADTIEFRESMKMIGAALVAAASKTQEPASVTIAEGAIKGGDVHIATPDVNVDNTINLPEQEPPVVNVNVPEPKPVTRKVKRDAKGRVEEVTEE